MPVQLCAGVMLQEEPQQQAPRQMVLGVQTPGMTMPFWVWQMSGRTMMQTPLGVQQADCGAGQMTWAQVLAKCQVPFAELQAASVRREHEPSGLQQALTHGLGVQEVRVEIGKPLQKLGLGTSVQDPSGRQQTMGGEQGLGTQVPAGTKVPLVHAPTLTTAHAPVCRLQQEPMQGLGLHAPPEIQVPLVHWVCETTAQLPVWRLQQEPRQGLGWQGT